MKKTIHLKSENIRIKVDTAEEISQNYNISLEGAVTKCIKHVYRYNEINMPKDIMISILWKAYKGINCSKAHLDIAQRKSIYQFLKKKDIENPYIEQFMKETEEKFDVKT